MVPVRTGVAYILTGLNDPQDTELAWSAYETGETQVLARPTDGWFVYSVAANNRWIAWVEQQGMPADPTTSVPWRVMVQQIDSDQTNELFSGQSPGPLTPGLSVVGDELVASVYRGMDERTSDFVRIALPDGTRETLASDVAGSQIAYDGEHLITTITEDVEGPGRSEEDLYLLKPTNTRALTHNNHSVGPQLSAGVLMWISGDRVYWRRFPGDGTRHLVIDHEDPYPGLGREFVSDLVNSDGFYAVKVIALRDPEVSRLLKPPQGSRLVVPIGYQRDRIAWPVAPHGDPARGMELVVSTVVVRRVT